MPGERGGNLNLKAPMSNIRNYELTRMSGHIMATRLASANAPTLVERLIDMLTRHWSGQFALPRPQSLNTHAGLEPE